MAEELGLTMDAARFELILTMKLQIQVRAGTHALCIIFPATRLMTPFAIVNSVIVGAR